jgi:hypothetical protein
MAKMSRFALQGAWNKEARRGTQAEILPWNIRWPWKTLEFST